MGQEGQQSRGCVGAGARNKGRGEGAELGLGRAAGGTCRFHRPLNSRGGQEQLLPARLERHSPRAMPMCS